jgi:small-conductance mechanosensitive channel
MSGISSSEALWSIAVILLVPIVIVGAAEIKERLRQSESPLIAPVNTVRNWVLPFFAAWALLVPVLAVDGDAWYRRVVSSGLVLSLTVAGLQVLRVIGEGILTRPSGPGRRPVPRLLLALPRLALLIGAGSVVIGGVWGVNLSAAMTALGVTSLVVSFALQDTLSGLASGVLLLNDRPFKTGDWISSGDTEGVVVDINWRTSRIRDRNGDLIIVPNSQLAGARVVNYSAPEPLHRVLVSLQVAYANPPTLAKKMLLDAARAVPGVLTEPPPGVLVTSIDDPMMGYTVAMWIDDYTIAPRVKSDFGALVWYQSHRQNVPLPSPAQDLFLHDPIAEAEAAKPTTAELREALRTAPLLEQLPDDDLDRLAHVARRARYRAEELMFDSASDGRDLLVIVEGAGRLVLLEPGFDEAVVSDVGVGDIVGLLDTRRGEQRVVALRAVTDCEVIVVPGDIMGEIGSRNAEVGAGFNRLVTLRQRRVRRLVEGRVSSLPSSADQAAGS